MKCNNCGHEISESTVFCAGCGMKVADANPVQEAAPESTPQPAQETSTQQAYTTPQYNQQTYTAPQYTAPQYNPYQNYNAAPVIPDEYKPISMWGYFGYQLLFAIPCIGLILLIVFSVGGTKNINLRNFARSYWCAFIIGLILAIIVAIIIVITGVSIRQYY
ncbi:MAG: zinc-ribbon domain-containing protein [Lachnospiraceae bacterium]|nr:zinc-ribbon domain-containing protein [Lachnospiraceae bacterium]